MRLGKHRHAEGVGTPKPLVLTIVRVMPLPEYVAPVFAVAGLPALIFVIMKGFPHAARAVVLLLAGVVAIVTRNQERRGACLKILDTLTRDGAPRGRGGRKLPR
jgi:hypothetical protein